MLLHPEKAVHGKEILSVLSFQLYNNFSDYLKYCLEAIESYSKTCLPKMLRELRITQSSASSFSEAPMITDETYTSGSAQFRIC